MKKVLFGILVVIILIQFIRPEKNISNLGTYDITTVMEVPEEVKEILKTSCADCHSNTTIYPWYSEIAPVSWYLAQHVNEGKEHLNFSEWAAYNTDQQNHILKDIKKELKKQGMPLESYLWIHNDAKMTETQYETLLNWVNTIPSE
ncbi:heme-binding domain-containing protein [uncultured Lutibacter sp.]|uniref:heme-binding domain-containing protein n=1 Tax=uncultured Lutibacter sp. TaxID=437739 RepID=UPI002633355B|nr:heme-binding domain-containing protein [uncultured Lutibacter sp.]